MSKEDRKRRPAKVEETKAKMTREDQQELIDRCITILEREGQDSVGNDRYTLRLSNMPEKPDKFRLFTLSTDVMIKHNLTRGGVSLSVQLNERDNRRNERWCMVFMTPAQPLTRPTTTKVSFVQWGHVAAGRDVLERLRKHMVMDDLAAL